MKLQLADIHIGERLKFMLDRRGDKTATELAEFMGISRNSVYKKMKSPDMYLKDIDMLCRYFDVSVEDFLGVEGVLRLSNKPAEHEVINQLSGNNDKLTVMQNDITEIKKMLSGVVARMN